MITDLHSSETIVGRLRIEGAGVDPALARMRVSSLLNSASLQAAQIAPAAIVFIRRFRDPMPGTLRLDQSGGYLPAVWDEAVKEALHRLGRGAARPALGAVPVGADAVVFLDRSELLACLAADWCEGFLAMRWWWQGLLKGGTVSQLVKQFWRDKPEYIPAALQHLANMKRVVDFASALSNAEARELVQRVAPRFGLHTLVPVLALSLEEVPSSTPSEKPADLSLPALTAPRKTESNQLPPRAPWSPWVPESEAPQLRPERQRFLGIALMTQRQPSRARAPSFAREVEQWQQLVMLPASTTRNRQREIETERRPPAIQQPEVRAQLDEAPRAAPAAHSNRDVPASSHTIERAQRSELVHAELYRSRAEALVDLAAEEPDTSPPTPAKQLPKAPIQFDFGSIKTYDDGSPGLRHSASPISDLNDAQQSALLEHESPARSADGIDPVKSDDLRSNKLEQQAAPMGTMEESELVSAIEIETELGGLFYLINLALYLNLYSDFTKPLEPGIELNIWDFVTLVGNELTGHKTHDDPIWSLLADLAGRDQDKPPGTDFEPPNEWRLPPQWLGPFAADGVADWSTRDERLQLLHADGFLVLDLSLESGDPSEQLQREIRPYENFLSPVSRIEAANSLFLENKPETADSLRMWLIRLMPYLRARLCRALGLLTQEELARILCLRRARVAVTATHVDVFFALAELPLEIRIAGLDRDPGWVPAAGRFITFHFE